MRGPFVRNKELKYQVRSDFKNENRLTPGSTSSSTEFDSVTLSDWSTRLVYRQSRHMARANRPLPYDTYGCKEVERPTFSYRSVAEYRNQTPWAAPWRTNHITRVVSGMVPRLPILGVPQLPEPTPEGALIHACLSRARNESINLAVTLAEMGQTASMISSRSRKISRAIQHIRKRRFRAAANTLNIRTPAGVSKTKSWSNNFLEYNYGWLPLVSDVCGAAQWLAEFIRTNPVLTVSARTSVDGKSIGTTASFRAFKPHDKYSLNSVESVTVSLLTTSVEYHEVTLNFGMRSVLLRELDKLGALNPAVAAHELVTLSFVLDWFVNVQDVLGAYSGVGGLDFLSGCYSRMTRSKQTVRHLSASPPALASGGKYIENNFSSTDGLYEGWNMRRTLYSHIPPPELIFAIPGTQQSKKALVSVALLRQRLS